MIENNSEVKNKIQKSFFAIDIADTQARIKFQSAIEKAYLEGIFPCIKTEETELDKQIVSLLDNAPSDEAKKALISVLSAHKKKDVAQFPCFCLSDGLSINKIQQVLNFFCKGFNMRINQFNEFVFDLGDDYFVKCNPDDLASTLLLQMSSSFLKGTAGKVAITVKDMIDGIMKELVDLTPKLVDRHKFNELRPRWDGRTGRLKHLFEDYWQIDKDTPSIAYESLMLSLACKVLNPNFYAPHMWDISGSGGIGKGVFIRNLINCFDPENLNGSDNTFQSLVMNSFPNTEQEFHKKLSHKQPLIIFDEEMSLIKETAGARSNESPFSLTKFKDWLGQNGSSGYGERELYKENSYVKRWGGYIVIRNTNSPEYMVYSPTERRQITLPLNAKGNSAGGESPIKPIELWTGKPDSFNPNCPEFYKQLWAEYIQKAEKLPRSRAGNLVWDFSPEEYHSLFLKKSEQSALAENPVNDGFVQYLSALENSVDEYLRFDRSNNIITFKEDWGMSLYREDVKKNRNTFSLCSYSANNGLVLENLPCGNYSLYSNYCKWNHLPVMPKSLFYSRIPQFCTAYEFTLLDGTIEYKRPRNIRRSAFSFYPKSLLTASLPC